MAAASSAAVLFGAFAGAVGINLLRGRTLGCGCRGGDDDRPISWGLVARNTAAAAAAVLLAVHPVALPAGADIVPIALTLLASALALHVGRTFYALWRQGRRISLALTRNGLT